VARACRAITGGELIALLDIGRGDPPLELLIGQAQDLLQFPDASVDVAYLNSVLNWVGDRPKAFDEAYRALKRCRRPGIGTRCGTGRTRSG
jgi:SAM-dependent methyltransferase